jgi:hypothetical protein
VARGEARAARGGEGADAAQRRARQAAAGAALGSDRQGVPLRNRRGERFAGRPLPRTLAAARLPLHVRPRLHGRVSVLLGDRGRVRRLCRPPRASRRRVHRGVAGAAREAAGVQAADGLELPLGVVVRERLQLRLRGDVHRGAAAVGSRRAQLPRDGDPQRARRRGRSCRLWHGPGDGSTGSAGHERVRARGRRRLPDLLGVHPRAGRSLGYVPVARPGATRTQRDNGARYG